MTNVGWSDAIPGALGLASGLLVMVGARRSGRAPMACLGVNILAIGLTDLCIELLNGRPLSPRLVEPAAILAVTLGAWALTAFHGHIVPGSPWVRRLRLGAVAVALGLIPSSLAHPFSDGDAARLALGTALVTVPWAGAAAVTLAAAGVRPRPAGSAGLRHASLVGGLALACTALTAKAVAFVLGSHPLLLATQVAMPISVALLAVGAVPPQWVRTLLYLRDLAAVERDRVTSLPDAHRRDDLDQVCGHALHHAVLLTGARGGLLADEDGRVLASRGLTADELGDAKRALASGAAADGTLLVVEVPQGVGRLVFCLVPASPLPVVGQAERQRLHELGMLVDASMHRVEAERRTQAEHDHLEALIAALEVKGTGVVRLEGWRLVYANAPAPTLLGVTARRLHEATDVRDVLPPEMARAGSALGEDGASAWARLTVHHDGARPGHVEVSSVSLGGDGDLILVLRDVTERVRAEQDLRLASRRLVEAQVLAGMGSWSMDADGGVVQRSPGMDRVWGATSDAFSLGVDGMLARVHPEDRELVRRHLDEALRGGRHWRFLHRVVGDQGEVRHIESRGRPQRDATGRVVRLEGTCIDVTAMQDLAARYRRQGERLRKLFLEVDRAREVERRRVALDLHDDVGQLLTALRIQMDLARQDVAHPTLDAAADLVVDLHRRVRSLALELRPAMLDRLGLGETLRWYAGHAADTLGLVVDLDLGTLNGQRFDADVETAAFRIVQEALSNVQRHAGTGRVGVAVDLTPGALHLEVRDRGEGFRRAQVPRDASGLGGIEERAAAVGGVATIASRPGVGTTVVVRLPKRAPTDVTS